MTDTAELHGTWVPTEELCSGCSRVLPWRRSRPIAVCIPAVGADAASVRVKLRRIGEIGTAMRSMRSAELATAPRIH
jgi:hypothetical protein